jgi:hypothetical protein
MTYTAEERRAYIDTARRYQPREELERKARKAKNRKNVLCMELNDLALRDSFDWGVRFGKGHKPHTHYCEQCATFGKFWNAETKTYGEPPKHKVGCTAHPLFEERGPYPGFPGYVPMANYFPQRADIQKAEG